MLVNLFSIDLKLLANTASKFLYNILIIICKKENANNETLFFVFSYYANDQSDL